MSSLRTWAAWSVITAVLLFSPALAFLLVMAVEILIDLLTEVGAPAPLAVAAGAFGYFLFRKMSPRPKVAPLYAGDEDALDEQAMAALSAWWAFTPGDFGHALYPDLNVLPGDLTVRKTRFSALVQGASDLDAILRTRGIDTLIIVGTATNVCCESTARDAMMLNYKVFFVSDANACRTDEEHNATLAIMMIMFADVRSTDEMIALLDRHAAPLAGAAE
jgi:nicotinamidase-related amidase